MSRRTRHQAIVLKSYDVGDADRFCILFTADRGKVAARVPGARKVKSRLGGLLLSLRVLDLELTESGSGFLVTAATPLPPFIADRDLRAVTLAQEGLELLLALLPDQAPLPELFTLSLDFLRLVSGGGQSLLVAYTLRTLAFLGLLPESSNVEFFGGLSAEETAFIRACLRGDPLSALADRDVRRLKHRTTALLAHGLSSPLRAPAVRAALSVE